ncbi:MULTISPECIES: acyl-CoA dehydrogenase family protein [Spongiibacter]|uniref:acyl-CoA dehydrogenase family protein n=1 Tax=Spongiibacter TaxID=630749 RepID=UPI000C5AFB8F|nr:MULTISPECIES: acyl-CoA dehydrogenase family protein [Spongiibacter]MAY38254.1 acyl-CoA dehydrogenase [Spongiibacter sp.]MBI57980.1 acyl-CoA dehydrogenase [Spongiibacter sp.]MBU73055.1 acyl-CoA dehydrogenase [Spongiibacter sp.]
MADLDQFRLEVRQWLEDNCPESQRKPITRDEQVWAGRNKSFPSDDARLWLERMADKGWTVPDWPTEYGGGGLDERQTKILREEMKALGCRTPLYDLGIWMLGPALLEFGNEEQKREHIPKIVRGDARWCQGYSEPGAGSDLASLQTRAEDKGDHFLVNGSKIWTTNADKSDWIFCLVRTDPDAKKQEGISFLLIDMDDPGVTTTPIELISGESEFCQTFFDNVKVPKKNLVSELNQGWSVAKALLKHERKLMSEVGGDTPAPSFGPVQAALEYVGLGDDGKLKDAGLRDQLVRHEMAFRALGLTHFRTFEERMSGQADSNVPLIMKYVGTEETKRKDELLVALLGHKALGWGGDGFNEDEDLTTRGWLFSKALSIAGGTSEVQLNIIAKRVLGLPQQ